MRNSKIDDKKNFRNQIQVLYLQPRPGGEIGKRCGLRSR